MSKTVDFTEDDKNNLSNLNGLVNLLLDLNNVELQKENPLISKLKEYAEINEEIADTSPNIEESIKASGRAQAFHKAISTVKLHLES